MKTRRTNSRVHEQAFSLIELLVVVSVILILAAIAIPRFMRSKISANETAAASACRAIATAEVTYENTYQQGYSPTLAALGPGSPASAANADMIDALLAAGSKGGYTFVYAPIDANGDGKPEQYTVNASPVNPGVTGDKYFYVDQTNVVRYNNGAPATATSNPVPQ